MADQSGDVCSFFKKPSRNKNIRKRTATESPEDEDNGDRSPQTSLPSQRPKKTIASDKALQFSTAAPSSKSSGNDVGEPEPKSEADIFHYESSKLIQVQNDSGATASLQTETEFDRDARAIRERVLKRAEESLKGKSRSETSDAKVYHGIHGYTDYKAGFRREQTVAGEKAGGAHGPLRASAHIRVSARFDYQPDICKDYKETGYCGFGDACKFMHDRGDYKSGWQLEKDWDEREKARKRALAMGGGREDAGGENDEDDDDNLELPFACSICRRPFEDAVMTKCKHYFCEHCALKHHSKNKKCFICNTPTLGIFNTAHEIRKKMAQEKQ
ncbi:zinc finger CCCH domain-containing protein 1-like [Phalaenopsis equestris]|uniref:zinc finger CCCH domain-containing protein 1-like n=1 Tax=Phalaenopsis equestris TaxID=78828 RepID=UPI0009E19FFA|nr:zinc finger CCCH domain-containing protein 1-like [Phalaenopsis equestris]